MIAKPIHIVFKRYVSADSYQQDAGQLLPWAEH